MLPGDCKGVWDPLDHSRCASQAIHLTAPLRVGADNVSFALERRELDIFGGFLALGYSPVRRRSCRSAMQRRQRCRVIQQRVELKRAKRATTQQGRRQGDMKLTGGREVNARLTQIDVNGRPPTTSGPMYAVALDTQQKQVATCSLNKVKPSPSVD